MVSINRVHKTIKALSNTDSVGNAKPETIDLLINQTVEEMYEDLFFEVNRLINRQNRGMLNTILENTTEKVREKIQHYLTDKTLTSNTNVFDIPKEVRFFDTILYKRTFIELMKNNKEFLLSEDTATDDTPIGLKTSNQLKVLPKEINQINITYLRNPRPAKWTFKTINQKEIFNSTASDFADIDIHPSQEDDLIISVLQKLGTNLKDKDIQEVTLRKETQEFNEQGVN